MDKSANLFDPVIRSRLAFNFLFDIQFALGVAAGWLMREGYSMLAALLEQLIKNNHRQRRVVLGLSQSQEITHE